MNVRDHLKDLSVDAIKNYCSENCVDAAVAMMHTEGDFNLSNVFRTTNFFGIREAYYIAGQKQWDRRGAVGVHHYTPVNYCKTVEDFWAIITEKGYTPVAIENNTNFDCQNIFTYTWPEKPVIILGEEQTGIPTGVLTNCKSVVTIPAFGSVRSLNVGSAAAIAIALYRNQIGR